MYIWFKQHFISNCRIATDSITYSCMCIFKETDQKKLQLLPTSSSYSDSLGEILMEQFCK